MHLGDKNHLYECIQKLKYDYEIGKIRDFEFTAGYICLYVQFNHGVHWCNGLSPIASASFSQTASPRTISSSSLQLKDIYGLMLPKRLEAASTLSLMDFVTQYSLKSIKQFVRQELMEWSLGEREFILIFSIPDPQVVLDQMIEGKRALSALTMKDELDSCQIDDYPPFKSRDALEFLIHDLQHMREFRGNPDFYREQLGFFKLCRDFLKPVFLVKIEQVLDDLFKKDLEHCLSDMNACSVHLFKFIKAKVIDAENRAVSRGESIDRQKQPILQIILEHWNVRPDPTDRNCKVWHAAMKSCLSKDPKGDIYLRAFFANAANVES